MVAIAVVIVATIAQGGSCIADGGSSIGLDHRGSSVADGWGSVGVADGWGGIGLDGNGRGIGLDDGLSMGDNLREGR